MKRSAELGQPRSYVTASPALAARVTACAPGHAVSGDPARLALRPERYRV